jgi:lysophospholipase L1-like esterase
VQAERSRATSRSFDATAHEEDKNVTKRTWPRRIVIVVLILGVLMIASTAHAQYWVSFANDTRYMALGDSLSAGYGAHPATQGFVYGLYQSGVIDSVNNTLFCDIGVPNATSGDILTHQVPQVALFFADTGIAYRQVITLTVGGNDLLQIFGGADPTAVLNTLAANLSAILGNLAGTFPLARIYVANLYDPALGLPGEAGAIAAANALIAQVVGSIPSATLVDVFSAFQGRSGLLLAERKGAEQLQVHPTNAGYQVMQKTFADAIGKH